MNGNLNTMLATIDKAGRLVVPKPIRDAMGLKPGAKLDISYADGRIEIEYAPVETTVRRLGKVKLLQRVSDETQPPLTDEMIRETKDAIYAEREARWL